MTRRRFKINFLDIIIVIALLALIAGVIWRQELSETVKQHDKENTVAVSCGFTYLAEEDERAVFDIGGNPDVYYKGVKVGTVAKVAETPELSEESEESGEGAVVALKNVLKLSAVEKESGYYIEGAKLLIGEQYRFTTDTWEFTVVIDSIELQ